MDTQEIAQNPSLQPFLKSFAPGEVLFREGDTAESMFVIVSGRVLLLEEKAEDHYVAGLLEEGQILGEKVLTTKLPYDRVFTAQAETETTVLELTPADLADIEKNDPPTMTALLRVILKVIAVRFDRANHLVRLLRTANVVERMIYVILYFRRCNARATPKGPEFVLSMENIHHYVDMDRETIAENLKALEKSKLLVRTGENLYLVPDEPALIAYGKKPIKKMAA